MTASQEFPCVAENTALKTRPAGAPEAISSGKSADRRKAITPLASRRTLCLQAKSAID
jgi:hypothetical protein